MIFFTSDTHFGHKNIVQYSNRPFDSVGHMNEAIIANWNAMVRDDDTVFHLGDVALGPWVEWDSILTRLNGIKTLVVGNHERIFKGEKPNAQAKFAEEYPKWFDYIFDNYTNFRLSDGTLANLSHFPYDGDSHDGDRFTDYRLKDNGTVLIHGHTHAEFDQHGLDARLSRSKRGTLQVHVGMDAWGYRPVSEEEVVALIKENV